MASEVFVWEYTAKNFGILNHAPILFPKPCVLASAGLVGYNILWLGVLPSDVRNEGREGPRGVRHTDTQDRTGPRQTERERERVGEGGGEGHTDKDTDKGTDKGTDRGTNAVKGTNTDTDSETGRQRRGRGQQEGGPRRR